jgi:hypothetical protein
MQQCQLCANLMRECSTDLGGMRGYVPTVDCNEDSPESHSMPPGWNNKSGFRIH